MKQRILFVCLGNICRSPAAEGIMRRLVADAGLEGVIEVDSAGTYGGHAGEDFAAFDCIVAMDDTNYEALCRMAPSREAIGKVCRMAEFFGPAYADRTYVPDPYYEGHEGFERVLDMLQEGCANLLAEVRSRIRS